MIPQTKTRLQMHGLDLSVTDPMERTTKYIYDEIFEGLTYAHPQIKLAPGASIIDVGANIGLFAIWAARTHRPKTILAYEASPVTNDCLIDNVTRNIDAGVTKTSCINLAVSREAGKQNAALDRRAARQG
jgi:ribosomal protein L11 methylase PrmA